MHQKNSKRLKKATKTRIKLRQLAMPSLSVHKTNQHIYAQIFSGDVETTLVSASTIE